jgi:DNA excision repair protein ERCC-3
MTATGAARHTAHPHNPLIVQSDRTVLLEVDNPRFERARDSLLRFAELEKSPEYMHTYRITPLSLWNAASSGMTYRGITDELEELSRYPVPSSLAVEIRGWLERWGKLVLARDRDGRLVLECGDEQLFSLITTNKKTRQYIYRADRLRAQLLEWSRGQIKRACIELGYPVVDRAGFDHGEPLRFRCRDSLRLRPYQQEAASVFLSYERTGGSGTVVLPCGAGKTIVGMEVMERIGERTLILVTNITAARQWKRELLEKTSLGEQDVGEYSGESKQIRPVTVATYQILTYRRDRNADFTHLRALNDRGWGLVIYDEVHLLPAPVFRFSCEVQGTRRLGLTATLVREDGRERDVFSLIGPKVYDVPWKTLEKQGWIAGVTCTEVRVALSGGERAAYLQENRRERFKRASLNPRKLPVVETLLRRHRNEQALVIGQYLSQLDELAARFGLALITGKTDNPFRERLYERFRKGELRVLAVSKVANFAVDLPDASVAIQVSGTFGSRQEEAQRLGRILRPGDGKSARFYTLVTGDTLEMDYAEKRQLFLIEQGYTYRIVQRETLDKKTPGPSKEEA